MKPITEIQAAWLRSVHELWVALHRSPTTIEVADAVGARQATVRQRVRRSVEDGHLVRGPRGPSTAPTSLRVAPMALVQIGVPIVAYLAWPFGSPDRGRLIAEWLARWRVYAISPCLIAHGLRATDIHASMAMRSDAVVVFSDPLLVGRDDVAAAARAGIPVTVVRPADEHAVTCAADLWTPPLLQPAP